jgi:transposase
MSVNALRGHLAEFGVIAAKGISHVDELVERTTAADLPEMVQATLRVLLAQLRSLDAVIDELERAIVADHRRDPISRLAVSIPGMGALAALRYWRARQIRGPSNPAAISPAWLGATPKQNSTGGKEKFGSITKQVNRYIRRLLVLGAISVLRAAQRRVVRLAGRAQSAQTTQGRGGGVGKTSSAITTGEVFRTSIYAKA